MRWRMASLTSSSPAISANVTSGISADTHCVSVLSCVLGALFPLRAPLFCGAPGASGLRIVGAGVSSASSKFSTISSSRMTRSLRAFFSSPVDRSASLDSVSAAVRSSRLASLMLPFSRAATPRL